ncbi:integrase, catalytic region, zinc finger, CCHC-type containing protein [Tanacetum coccineum]|uniref:Integrase, catalytic region, zinc finger, CCHC-type containing protein n=1 Tax=Tanacetum coccineum TaxID=301880 RepID=A0ABQ4Z3D9_9ASTR
MRPIEMKSLNRLTEDFGKCFTPQQELSAEQAFWLRISNPTIEPSNKLPIIVEVPSELPKCDLSETCLNLDAELSKSKQAYKYFVINDLKARLQDKDTTIRKLEDTIKSLEKNTKEKNVHHEKCDLEPINEEMDNSVATLLSENEQLWNEINHVKQVFKDQFDLIKQTRVRHKEQWKEIIENASQIPSATTIAPSMFKLDLVPFPPRLLQNREAHIDYIKHTQENAIILREIVKLAKAKQPLDSELDFAWNRSRLMNFVSKFLGTVRFGNDQIARIMGYGDYQLGNVIISRVYYVEGLGHNLFFVGQFCDADLEVVFQKNTCFIRNLEGVDLLSGSRDTNLYTISLDDMLKSSPIFFLSKASKTKSWLWHRRLSHLNFGTLNKLAKDGLARGIPRLKFQKDHLCSACALGKSKKSSHQPKAEDTNQEKLYLLHMDLSGPSVWPVLTGKVN